MPRPLVSVLIPTFNRRDLVLEAVASAVAQSYPSVEVIVIDDGSTDGTSHAIPGAEVVVLPRRCGPAAARNAGIAVARGSFIALLDSDDLWDPDFLDRSMAALEALDLDFVFSNWRHAQHPASALTIARQPRLEHARRFQEWTMVSPAALRWWYLRGCPSPSSSLVVRRSSMAFGWNERMRVGDDWHFVLNLILTGPVRAAFTLLPRWTKRVDGKNRYESQSEREAATNQICDLRLLRAEFAAYLTVGDRARWWVRQRTVQLGGPRARQAIHDWRRGRYPVPAPRGLAR